MLSRLLSALSGSPRVELLDQEDGLVAVSCKKVLKFDSKSVKLKTASGTVAARVSVESFDHSNSIYRLRVLDDSALPKVLDPNRCDEVRLPKVLRVTSRAFPQFAGTTEDISLSGLRVCTRGVLETGAEIAVTLELDDSRVAPMVVNALVAWSGEKSDGTFQSGLRFTAMHPETKNIIKHYIKSRLATEKRLHTLEDVDPFEVM